MTIKGFMKGVLGNQWILKHSLPTVTWFPPNSPHPSCLAELEKTLESDVDDLQVREPGDFYFWGGAFARDATLATIAEHIGREDLRERAINVVKQSMGYFFDPAHFPRAAYERLWGGMVNDRDLNYTKVGQIKSGLFLKKRLTHNSLSRLTTMIIIFCTVIGFTVQRLSRARIQIGLTSIWIFLISKSDSKFS